MGTTCTHKPKGMSMKEFFVEHGVLRWGDDLPHTYRVLETAYKMPVFYAAIEKVCKKTGEREVWAAVIKVHQQARGQEPYDFCYKEMTEHEGPFYYGCPAKILDLLTPTEHESANAWRAKCREQLAFAEAQRKRKIGPNVVLVYGSHRYTVLEKLPRGYYRVANEHGVVYRMRPGQVREARMETPAQAA